MYFEVLYISYIYVVQDLCNTYPNLDTYVLDDEDHLALTRQEHL